VTKHDQIIIIKYAATKTNINDAITWFSKHNKQLFVTK
jgi:hypothetical protein